MLARYKAPIQAAVLTMNAPTHHRGQGQYETAPALATPAEGASGLLRRLDPKGFVRLAPLWSRLQTIAVAMTQRVETSIEVVTKQHHKVVAAIPDEQGGKQHRRE
jgi:hypothetical protein